MSVVFLWRKVSLIERTINNTAAQKQRGDEKEGFAREKKWKRSLSLSLILRFWTYSSRFNLEKGDRFLLYALWSYLLLIDRCFHSLLNLSLSLSRLRSWFRVGFDYLDPFLVLLGSEILMLIDDFDKVSV